MDDSRGTDGRTLQRPRILQKSPEAVLPSPEVKRWYSMNFFLELLKACKAFGWTTAIETTGMASPEVIEKDYSLARCCYDGYQNIFDPEVHKRVYWSK